MKNTGSKVIVLLLLLNHYWLIACPYKCISEEFNLRDRQHVPVVPERALISQPRVEYPPPHYTRPPPPPQTKKNIIQTFFSFFQKFLSTILIF